MRSAKQTSEYTAYLGACEGVGTRNYGPESPPNHLLISTRMYAARNMWVRMRLKPCRVAVSYAS